MAAPAIQPKYLFAKAADFDKSWPIPEGFYLQIYYDQDPAGKFYEKAFTNVKVTKDQFTYYDAAGKLIKPMTLAAAGDFLKQNIEQDVVQFGFVGLAKDPIGTPGQASTPTPAYLMEQGLPVVYLYDESKDFDNPAMWPPPDGDYKAEFYDPSATPNPTPVATKVYIVKNKGFTELAVDKDGKAVSKSVTADSVKADILAQISKSGSVTFTTIKIVKDDEGDTKEQKAGISPLVLAIVAIGAFYLLTRKKG